MQPITINTKAGDLTLVPATVDELRGIATYWPMELIGLEDKPGYYGLIFQHGDQEVHGVKMQMVEIPSDEAACRHGLYRILIAAALAYYLEKQHQGVMVPCVYINDTRSGLTEAGIAFFVGPDPASKSNSGLPQAEYLDESLGDGAREMVFDMMQALADALAQYKIPSLNVIGLEVIPRLALGRIVFYFAIQGSDVIVVKDQMIDNDLVWDFTVRAGFTRLPYAPMTPMGFESTPPPDMLHV